MLKLVYRDLFIYQRRNLVILPLFALYFLFVTGGSWGEFGSLAPFFIMICMFSALMVIQTASAYDETSKFNKYLRSMPVPCSTIVLSRYLSCLFSAAMGAAWILLFSLASQLLPASLGLPKITISFLPGDIPMVLSLLVLISSILLPIVFKFGYQKAKYPLMLTLMAAIGVLPALISSIMPSQPLSPGFFWILLMASLIVLYFSIGFSIKIVRTQEV